MRKNNDEVEFYFAEVDSFFCPRIHLLELVDIVGKIPDAAQKRPNLPKKELLLAKNAIKENALEKAKLKP